MLKPFLIMLLFLTFSLSNAYAATTLSGTVFDDPNYGGGAGRSLTTSSGVGVSGATIELYDATGTLVTTVTSAGGGAYNFATVDPGDYYVRVVSDSVNSSRSGSTGAELGVMTFRTDGTTDVTSEVGGRNPAVADSAANSGTETLNTTTFVLSGGGQAQAVQPITVGATPISGVDFGFNFSTIVNTNNAGQGSLRQFILNSNLLANTGLDQVDNPSDGAPDPAAGVETSIFMIPGSGAHTISLSSILPTITGAATAIDASTQDGVSCSAATRTLTVTLDGTSAGSLVSGLNIDAANVHVRGIAIGKFTESGITGTANGDGLVVTCSNLGLAADGTTLLTNTLHGIHAKSGLSGLILGGSSVDDRNIISGNARNGAFLEGASNAIIDHNYIGTSADGLSARSNNREGVAYAGIVTSAAAATNIMIRNNLISGGDIITGTGPVNVTSGIRLENLSNNITITGNLIGTNPSGTAALANTGYGIYIQNVTDITIGGLTAAERNIISGNGKDGINTRFGTKRLNIYGNYIGVDITGTVALGNTDNGIFLADTQTTNIGNADPSGRNIITGNKISGIRNSASTITSIAGNYIGVDATGTAAPGNTLHGIFVQNSSDVTIGGSTVGARNVVSGNKVIGIFMQNINAATTTTTRIEGNYIGLLPDGDTAAGNTQSGIESSWSAGTLTGNVIHNNVISGNKTRGIHPVNSASTTITNNIIGLNAAGTAARPNIEHGIDIDIAASDLLIENNVISGNTKSGIRVFTGTATNGRIINNRIGVGVDGVTAFGNSISGILIDGATGITVGGSGATDSNIIAYNTGDAVSLTGTGSKANIISRNIMFANTNLGIDLDDNNVTLNDGSALSTGANEGLNFPQFKQVTLLGGNLTVNGCAPAGATIELFEADVSPTSGSGVAAGSNQIGRTLDYGEGERYLATFVEGVGEETPTTTIDCATLTDTDANNATGMSVFQWTIPVPSNVVLGDKLTATSTIAASGTSEFSSVSSVVLGNVAPVITSDGGGATAALSVAENQTAVTTVTATDANPTDTLTYSVNGGADAAKFAINASTGVLTFVTAPDFENPTDADTNNTYLVQVTVDDGNGGTTIQDLTITVTDAAENVAPVISSDGGTATAALSVAENQTAVTTVTATDANPTDTLTYSITGGADSAKFAIDTNTGVLTFTTAPDFENPTDADTNNTYLVQVTVSDGNGGTDIQDITVTVTDVAENVAPDITSDGGTATAALSVAENQTAVTTVAATDANGDTLTYSISGGTDAAKFAIDTNTGVLTFTTAPDFENPTDADTNNTYLVQVTVSDGNGGTDVQDITVTVTDVAENVAPDITSDGGTATAALSVAENQTAVTTVTATDANPTDTLTYSISGGTDAAKFAIDTNTGVLTFITAPDFENPTDADTNNAYEVQVTVSDNNGGTDIQDITVTVTDVAENIAPVITSDGGGATAALSVPEGTATVTTVVATDANPTDTLTYSISGGVDAALFGIDASTGVLIFNTIPNFTTPTDADSNNVYEVQVSVSDGQATAVQDLTVTVTDVSVQVLEYTVRRAVDGRYHVYMRPTIDPVLGPNLSFTGQITLTVPTGVGANQFMVNDLQTAVPGVTWAMNSRANAPTESSGTDYLSFNFTPNGTNLFNWQAGVELEVFNFTNPNACVGVVAVMEDADPFNAQPNSVGSVPGNQFTNTGWGSPTDNNYLANYGSPVDCVNNVPPVINSDGGGATAALSMVENQTAVTTVTATDANTTDTLTYSISGGADAAKFAIDATTGVLSFVTAPSFATPTDADTNNVYEVQVTVTDSSANTAVQDISVTITSTPAGVVVQVRGFLQGPFNGSTSLMEDSLRTLNLIPSAQPYTMAPFAYTGTESADNTLLAVSGNDAIVDWVLVELRDAASPTTILAQQAALLQRDGDVVRPDTGSVDLTFSSISAGNYYVSLRHRNHLGVISASALPLSSTPTMVDFIQLSTAVMGTNPRMQAAGLALMWAGDANRTSQVIASGPNNDTSDILGVVLMAVNNTLLNSNFRLDGYQVTDLDLNGSTLFAGPSNDTNLVIGNVLVHPGNSTYSANFVIQGGIPQN